MIPRCKVVQKDKVGSYHCTSRCVRRAFLCGVDSISGRDYSHRREWLAMRIRELARAFAIDVDAWSVMQNHFHVVLTRRPDLARAWSDREVVTRWLAVKPLKSRGRVLVATDEAIESILNHRAQVADYRERLCGLDWFHSLIKQPLAAMANREDGCTGRFWEGRYEAEVITGPTHLFAASVYVDLNPIRAKLAGTPEESDFTSVQDRIRAQQLVESGCIDQPEHAEQASHLFRCEARDVTNADADVWLTPIGKWGDRRGLHRTMKLAEYITVVDVSGRQIRRGKPGRIDPRLPSILDRLKIDAGRFIEAMRTGENLSDVGSH